MPNRVTIFILGGRFASRLFVTNQFPPPETDKDYMKFLAQAKDREIVVVTGETLPNISQILRDEALRPTYWRI